MAYNIANNVKIVDKSEHRELPKDAYGIYSSANGFSKSIDKLALEVGHNLIIANAYGNYSGIITADVEAYIDPFNALIDFIPAQTYTGNEIKPPITVKVKNGNQYEPIHQKLPKKPITYPLTGDPVFITAFNEYTCYNITYSNNINVGNRAQVTISPNDNHRSTCGTKTQYFEIKALNINNNSIQITGIESRIQYKGEPIEQNVEVKFNGSNLTKGTDYTITYGNNNNVGHASCKISGSNNFTGYKEFPFDIYGDLSDANVADSNGTLIENVSYEFNGQDQIPALSVQFYSMKLTNNQQYSTSWQNTTDFKYPGEKNGQIRAITGSGYQNSKSFSYKIVGNINDATFVGGNISYKKTGNDIKPTIELNFNGKVLTTDDYSIEYPSSDYKNSGEKIIRFKGIGYYTNVKDFKYTIYDTTQTVVYKNDNTVSLVGNNQLTRDALSIGSSSNNSIVKVIVGSNVDNLQNNLFSNCVALEEVDFSQCSDNLELPEGCFDGCASLKNIVFPQSNGQSQG